MENKVLVVTGATKGIGKAVAELFASRGYDIIGCARNKDQVRESEATLKKNYPDVKISYVALDVSVKFDLDAFVRHVKAHSKKVDILVNNAGLFVPGQIHQEEEGVLENLISTNLYSAYYLTKGLLADMIENKSGHIFNICSTASITPYVNGGSYCITKYALYGMTKVLREEMKPYNIKVTAVLPGATYTASWEGADLPEERFMKASDVAESIYQVSKLSDRTVVEEILLRPQLGDL